MEQVAHRRHPNYIGVFIGLAVLTAVELTVAFLPWGKRTIILLLIFLAVWKALMVALYFMWYNFGRVHQTLRVTPAMEAGITDHVWSVEEIIALLDA